MPLMSVEQERRERALSRAREELEEDAFLRDWTRGKARAWSFPASSRAELLHGWTGGTTYIEPLA